MREEWYNTSEWCAWCLLNQRLARQSLLVYAAFPGLTVHFLRPLHSLRSEHVKLLMMDVYHGLWVCIWLLKHSRVIVWGTVKPTVEPLVCYLYTTNTTFVFKTLFFCILLIFSACSPWQSQSWNVTFLFLCSLFFISWCLSVANTM